MVPHVDLLIKVAFCSVTALHVQVGLDLGASMVVYVHVQMFSRRQIQKVGDGLVDERSDNILRNLTFCDVCVTTPQDF